MRSFSLLVPFLAVFFLGTISGAEEKERPLIRALLGDSAAAPQSSSEPAKRQTSSRATERPSGSGLFANLGEGLKVGGGPKRVEVNLSTQMLRAYEGNRLVMKTRISSGRGGITPTGRYRAGPYKSAEHYSSLYHNAPMPWSVQVSGHIFIHGFHTVPDYPASRGCIRVPIDGRNPARRFFNWVDVGTPIVISY